MLAAQSTRLSRCQGPITALIGRGPALRMRRSVQMATAELSTDTVQPASHRYFAFRVAICAPRPMSEYYSTSRGGRESLHGKVKPLVAVSELFN